MRDNLICLNHKIGFRDGLPVGIGYFAISFAFGLMASGYGFPVLESVMISAFCLTSAGQLAALPTIAALGSYAELLLTQFLINLRYSLMSISLSQRFDRSIKTRDKLYLSFALTDEIFAVAIGKEQKITKKYLLALLIPPYVGWVLGTLLGAIAGSILPDMIVDALSVSMYAMFIAILVPVIKVSKPILVCVLSSVALSCLFKYVPVLNKIPGGFVIIIIAIAVSVPLALAAPIPDEAQGSEKSKDENGEKGVSANA
jgi:4-azaleucine resistance transporter AzlC